MEPRQKPDKPWFLDAALVIPSLILIGYICALSQTMCEYDHFNIPPSFISLSPTYVLVRILPFLATIVYLIICSLASPIFMYFVENKFPLAYWVIVFAIGFG